MIVFVAIGVGLIAFSVWSFGRGFAILDEQKAAKLARTKCPYCGVMGHDKTFHVPKP